MAKCKECGSADIEPEEEDSPAFCRECGTEVTDENISEEDRLARAEEHADGVTVETLSEGEGIKYPKPGDELSMHYTGTLKSNGREFGSSSDKSSGKAFTFKVGAGQGETK